MERVGVGKVARQESRRGDRRKKENGREEASEK